MLLFVLIGAVAGWLIGGFLGLVFGAATGYGLGWFMLRLALPVGQAGLEGQYLDVTFAVMGALCKADGRVSQAEIGVAEAYFDKLALSQEQRRVARESFARGKCVGFDLYREVSALRRLLRHNQALLQLFLQVQLSAIAADGRVHEAEHRMMLRVAQALGLSEADVERLEAMLRHSSVGSDVPTAQAREDAYAVLGVSSSASDAEVKRAYRRLMSRYHPDKFAAEGLCERMRAVAEERVLEVRKAYDTVRRQRGMSK
ncbi:MAG: co-chaperone DjlA [Wenzhouxiangella sp.]|nr:MAG: co-chaperone DjlA [Wenzhouxiangella sp.]